MRVPRWLGFCLIGCLLYGWLAPLVAAETLTFRDGSTVDAQPRRAELHGMTCIIHEEELWIDWRHFTYAEVIRLWKVLLPQSGPEGLYELASYCLATRHYADAKEYFAKAVEAHPELQANYADRIADAAVKFATSTAQSLADAILQAVSDAQGGSPKKGLETLRELLTTSDPVELDAAAALTPQGSVDALMALLIDLETRFFTAAGWELVDGKWMSPSDARAWLAGKAKDVTALKEKHAAFLTQVFGPELGALRVKPGEFVVLFAMHDIAPADAAPYEAVWKFCRDVYGAQYPAYEPFPVAIIEGRNAFRAYLKSQLLGPDDLERMHVWSDKSHLVTYSYVDPHRLTFDAAQAALRAFAPPFHAQNGWLTCNAPLMVEAALLPDWKWKDWLVDRVNKSQCGRIDNVLRDSGRMDAARLTTGELTWPAERIEAASFIYYLASSPKTKRDWPGMLERLRKEDWRNVFVTDELIYWQMQWREYFVENAR